MFLCLQRLHLDIHFSEWLRPMYVRKCSRKEERLLASYHTMESGKPYATSVEIMRATRSNGAQEIETNVVQDTKKRKEP